MTSAAGTAEPSRGVHRRVARGLTLLPMLVLCAGIVLAAASVSYILWPRWPGPAVLPTMPALPVMIGEVTFNIPPGAIRVPLQRKPGAQDRVDLVFPWPFAAEAKPSDRVFVTITTASGMSPVERFMTRFPRDWLADWRAVAEGIDRLIGSLKPH